MLIITKDRLIIDKEGKAVSDTTTISSTVVEPQDPQRDEVVTEELVEDDLLVEDVSIDGMCGVY